MPSTADPADEHRGDTCRIRLIASTLVALAIFAVDTFTSLQSAVAVLYMLVLIIADDGASRKPILWLCGVSTLLTLLSFALTHALRAETGAFLRVLFSLSTIGITAALILRNRVVQAAARDNDARYRTIFNTLAVAIWEHDFREVQREMASLRASGVTDLRFWLTAHPDFVIRMRKLVKIANANTSAYRLLQVPEGQPFFTHLSQILPEEDESFLEGLIVLDGGAGLFETETRLRTWQGELIDVFIALTFPTGAGLDCISGSVTDVTERKRFQATLDRTRSELDRAIRAAALGEMSASIAHEVSQPLTAVRTCTEAARRWLGRMPPDLAEAQAAMAQAAREAENAGEVVNRVRSMVSRSAPDMVSLGVDELVSSAITLVQRQSGGVELVYHSRTPTALVVGDRVLLQQLLINILNNALEACVSSGTPTPQVTVETILEHGEVVIAVTDNGPGLSAQELERAFDPFFSTRQSGIGLGLTMSRSIAGDHGGVIGIEDRVDGQGTVTTIRLPVAP